MIKISMKKLILILLAISFFLPSTLVFAQTTQNDEVTQVLSDIENERTKKLQDTLGLTVPLETDNPNHILTFKDPSGKGVKMEINGQGFKTIKSPYTLPSLGIGSHILTFKFTDKEETSQSLEKDLVVIPRPPIVNAPSKVSKSEITIGGTALAGSIVDLFISGDTLNFKGSAQVGTDGSWSHTFKEGFKYSVYTIIARTKKNGFSSNLSEPVVFELSALDNGSRSNTKEIRPIYFDFTQFTPNNFFPTLKNNPHLIILALVFAIFGGLMTWWIESVSSRKVNKTAEGKFIKLLSEKEQPKKTKEKGNKEVTKIDNTDKKMTLKEKFEKAGFKLPQIQPDEKTLSKEEFLESFKQEDPDDNKGKEKTEIPKDEKKKVEVSLTSKKA